MTWAVDGEIHVAMIAEIPAGMTEEIPVEMIAIMIATLHHQHHGRVLAAVMTGGNGIIDETIVIILDVVTMIGAGTRNLCGIGGRGKLRVIKI